MAKMAKKMCQKYAFLDAFSECMHSDKCPKKAKKEDLEKSPTFLTVFW
jgi:hypothetical protein